MTNSWQTATLLNNVQNHNGTTKYRKCGDVVELNLTLKNITTIGVVGFTLPEGYRPSEPQIIITGTGGTGKLLSTVMVDPSGDVKLYPNESQYTIGSVVFII